MRHRSGPIGETVAASEAYRRTVGNRRRYEKGRHTSFANCSVAVDDSMRARRDYKAKRQDGKQLVVLVGMPKAVAIAVKRADATRRCSALRERLQRQGDSQ